MDHGIPISGEANLSKVFVTYSHDNESHKVKVLALSNSLREQGIDVSLDAYNQHPPEGWPKWMERQFQSEFVIVVISPRYITDFNQDISNSSGARYEGGMLSARLNATGLSYEKIGIICFDEWNDLILPPVLHGCTRYFIDRAGEYRKLYSFLTSQPLVEKPPLGTLIPLKPSTRPTFNKFSDVNEITFQDMCRAIWPIMEENRRIFDDFGPNSGEKVSGERNRSVRFDLSIWKIRRKSIDENNKKIAEQLKMNSRIIPDAYNDIFRKWLSHIDAFTLHLIDENVDYREHQFPKQIVEVIKENL